MVVLRELAAKDQAYIREIAKLHKRSFPSFFLSQLGLPFLEALYFGYLEDGGSGIIIAEEAEKLVGFAAYSYDYSRLYKQLIKKHIVRFMVCSLGAAIRHPSFIKRLFGAFRKSGSVVKDERYVELASICVDPSAEGRGIGTKMIDYLKSMVDFNAFAYINLETDAVDNEAANRFYQKNGFILARQYVTGEGRKMNEYRFSTKVMA